MSKARRGSMPQAAALSTTAPLVVLPCLRLMVLLTSVFAAIWTVAATASDVVVVEVPLPLPAGGGATLTLSPGPWAPPAPFGVAAVLAAAGVDDDDSVLTDVLS